MQKTALTSNVGAFFMPQEEVDRKDRRSCGDDNGIGQGDKERERNK